MYTKYFGLREKPFSIAPNPEYVYMSKLHKEALAHLIYGMQEDGCLGLLTGGVGTGKTTICRCLLENISENIDVAVVFNPKISPLDLLRSICKELQINSPENVEENSVYIDKLNEYLLKAHANGRTTVLIIDEAQGLSSEVIEQLRLLTNLETNTHKLLKIVLLGQPELASTLAKPSLAQVNQRVTSRYHLSPLSYEDTVSYVLHRMHIAGGGQNRYFSDKALKILFKTSEGVPRKINLICDRALLGAYAENRAYVDHVTIKQAIKEIIGTAKPKTHPKEGRLARLNTLLIITILTALFIYYIQYKTKQLDDQTNSLSGTQSLQDNSHKDAANKTEQRDQLRINIKELEAQ